MRKKKNNFVKLLILITVITLNSFYSMCQTIPSYQNYSSGLSNSDQQALNALAYEEQTTAYGTSTGINVIGTGNAQVLDINATDFNSINLNSPLLANVKLIRLRYNSTNDFTQVLNMSGVTSLSNLNYILLLSSVNATSIQINGALQNIPSTVAGFYSISIPN